MEDYIQRHPNNRMSTNQLGPEHFTSKLYFVDEDRVLRVLWSDVGGPDEVDQIRRDGDQLNIRFWGSDLFRKEYTS